MANTTELQVWKEGIIKYLQGIDRPGETGKILQAVLRKHNRVNSAVYLPTESDLAKLRTQNPCQSARIVLEILLHFSHELAQSRIRCYTWLQGIAEDAIDLLNFQITHLFGRIKESLIKACKLFHEKPGCKMESSYCQREYKTFEELGKYLENT